MTYALNQLLDVQITDARFVGANAEGMVANYSDEASLDTHLNAASAGTFTPAVLATMTVNDKIFAVRSYLDPLSFGTPGNTSI